MARSVFALTLQLAAMGFIGVKEDQEAAEHVSDDGMDEVMGAKS